MKSHLSPKIIKKIIVQNGEKSSLDFFSFSVKTRIKTSNQNFWISQKVIPKNPVFSIKFESWVLISMIWYKKNKIKIVIPRYNVLMYDQQL